jgi:hypothetical protein
MGRSFESIRMSVKEVSARWLKASKALKKEDQIYGQKAELARKHSSEAFYALDDPLGGSSVLCAGGAGEGFDEYTIDAYPDAAKPLFFICHII